MALQSRIITNGKIADLRSARKVYWCKHCGETILPYELYYAATIAGGGVYSLRDPDRVHTKCVNEFIGGN